MNRVQETSLRSLSAIAGLIVGLIVGSLISAVVRKIWLSETISPQFLPYYSWGFRIIFCFVFVDNYLTAAGHLIKITDLKRQHRRRFFALRRYNNIPDSFWLDFCWAYSWTHLELVGGFLAFWGVLFLVAKILSPSLRGVSWIVAFIAACLSAESISLIINSLFIPRRLLDEFKNASDIFNIFSSHNDDASSLSEDGQDKRSNVRRMQNSTQVKKKSSSDGETY